jgi:hypothetical protein
MVQTHHPFVQLMPVSEHTLPLTARNTMNREFLFLLPSDDRADISPQIGGNLLPRVDSLAVSRI